MDVSLPIRYTTWLTDLDERTSAFRGNPEPSAVPLPRWVEEMGCLCVCGSCHDQIRLPWQKNAILGVEFMTLAVLPYEQTIALGRLSLGMFVLGLCLNREQLNQLNAACGSLAPTRKHPWKVPVSVYIQLLSLIPDTPCPTRTVLCTLRQRKIQSLGSFVGMKRPVIVHSSPWECNSSSFTDLNCQTGLK